MKIDKFSQILLNEQEIFDALYSGQLQSLENVLIDFDPDQFNSSIDLNGDKIQKLSEPQSDHQLSIEKFDEYNRSNWFIPQNFKNLDIISHIHEKCKTELEILRVNSELELYKKYNMLDVLKFLKYLVDFMQQENLVFGVGRGSSVASYVLFLLGVHRIDSIKYNLDITEFLKEN